MPAGPAGQGDAIPLAHDPELSVWRRLAGAGRRRRRRCGRHGDAEVVETERAGFRRLNPDETRRCPVATRAERGLRTVQGQLREARVGSGLQEEVGKGRVEGDSSSIAGSDGLKSPGGAS